GRAAAVHAITPITNPAQTAGTNGTVVEPAVGPDRPRSKAKSTTRTRPVAAVAKKNVTTADHETTAADAAASAMTFTSPSPIAGGDHHHNAPSTRSVAAPANEMRPSGANEPSR